MRRRSRGAGEAFWLPNLACGYILSAQKTFHRHATTILHLTGCGYRTPFSRGLPSQQKGVNILPRRRMAGVWAPVVPDDCHSERPPGGLQGEGVRIARVDAVD